MLLGQRAQRIPQAAGQPVCCLRAVPRQTRGAQTRGLHRPHTGPRSLPGTGCNLGPMDSHQHRAIPEGLSCEPSAGTPLSRAGGAGGGDPVAAGLCGRRPLTGTRSDLRTVLWTSVVGQACGPALCKAVDYGRSSGSISCMNHEKWGPASQTMALVQRKRSSQGHCEGPTPRERALPVCGHTADSGH